jgi:hypothetical protein
MNVLNKNVEFIETSSKIAKTDNVILSYLNDSGVDVESINQTPLKLQRLKLSQVTWKHFTGKKSVSSNDFMSIHEVSKCFSNSTLGYNPYSELY